MIKSKRLFAVGTVLCLMLSGCMVGENEIKPSSVNKPVLPQKLSENEKGVPVLDVYNISTKQIEQVDIEEYVMGVVAGEMKNDWPIEALKAQAILARTFVLKFCDTKQSRYEGADISTDIEEAQAYAPENINDRVRQAIEDTRGQVMSADGEYPHAWFFAHAGGKTELPSIALDYNDVDPDYLAVVDSPDSEKAPDDVKNWTVEFTFDEVMHATEKLGLELENITSVEMGEKGASGRVKTIAINGREISAPSFRIAIGAGKLKSTMLTDIEIGEDRVTFSGSGYGHGVGMSQWGAYALAEEGKSAEAIVLHYFSGIDIVDMW